MPTSWLRPPAAAPSTRELVLLHLSPQEKQEKGASSDIIKECNSGKPTVSPNVTCVGRRTEQTAHFHIQYPCAATSLARSLVRNPIPHQKTLQASNTPNVCPLHPHSNRNHGRSSGRSYLETPQVRRRWCVLRRTQRVLPAGAGRGRLLRR